MTIKTKWPIGGSVRRPLPLPVLTVLFAVWLCGLFCACAGTSMDTEPPYQEYAIRECLYWAPYHSLSPPRFSLNLRMALSEDGGYIIEAQKEPGAGDTAKSTGGETAGRGEDSRLPYLGWLSSESREGYMDRDHPIPLDEKEWSELFIGEPKGIPEDVRCQNPEDCYYVELSEELRLYRMGGESLWLVKLNFTPDGTPLADCIWNVERV